MSSIWLADSRIMSKCFFALQDASVCSPRRVLEQGIALGKVGCTDFLCHAMKATLAMPLESMTAPTMMKLQHARTNRSFEIACDMWVKPASFPCPPTHPPFRGANAQEAKILRGSMDFATMMAKTLRSRKVDQAQATNTEVSVLGGPFP